MTAANDSLELAPMALRAASKGDAECCRSDSAFATAAITLKRAILSCCRIAKYAISCSGRTLTRSTCATIGWDPFPAAARFFPFLPFLLFLPFLPRGGGGGAGEKKPRLIDRSGPPLSIPRACCTTVSAPERTFIPS